jgi:hypothetical protein
MLSRCIAILIGTWLPMLAVILPFGPTHTANAIIAGVLATALSLASLSDNRFRVATAVVGGWVALSPFVFPSTLLEEVVTVTWGVITFVCMIGPFSDKPVTMLTQVLARRVPPLETIPEVAKAA